MHADPSVVVQRFEAVSKAAAALVMAGRFVFCPIAHSHPMAVYGGLAGNWDFWKNIDEQWLGLCSEFHVLKLVGWEHSTGVAAETEIAKEMGLPIFYHELGEFI